MSTVRIIIAAKKGNGVRESDMNLEAANRLLKDVMASEGPGLDELMQDIENKNRSMSLRCNTLRSKVSYVYRLDDKQYDKDKAAQLADKIAQLKKEALDFGGKLLELQKSQRTPEAENKIEEQIRRCNGIFFDCDWLGQNLEIRFKKYMDNASNDQGTGNGNTVGAGNGFRSDSPMFEASRMVENQAGKFDAIKAQVERVIAMPDGVFDQSKAIFLAKRLIKAEFEAYAVLGKIQANTDAQTDDEIRACECMADDLIEIANGYQDLQDDLQLRFLASAGLQVMDEEEFTQEKEPANEPDPKSNDSKLRPTAEIFPHIYKMQETISAMLEALNKQ